MSPFAICGLVLSVLVEEEQGTGVEVVSLLCVCVISSCVLTGLVRGYFFGGGGGGEGDKCCDCVNGEG